MQDPIQKNNSREKGLAQVVQWLFSKREALSSNLNTAPQKLPIYLSIYLYVYQSIYHLSICLSMTSWPPRAQ
jgi:hypothetical protein